MTGGCSDLTIMWSDGSSDSSGNMIWHLPSSASVWTSDDLGNWPKAILLRFRLTDPYLPEGMNGALYEIICELPP